VHYSINIYLIKYFQNSKALNLVDNFELHFVSTNLQITKKAIIGIKQIKRIGAPKFSKKFSD